MTQLIIASLMVGLTVVMHLAGLGLLVALMRRHHRTSGGHLTRAPQLIAIFGAALGLFALHSAEIWTYALLYSLLGALPNFADALYFSTTTYSTVGFGDLVLSPPWRMIGAIEGANGIILLGWSTAFFVSVINQIRIFEHGGPTSGNVSSGGGA